MTRFGPDHLLQGINDRAMIALIVPGLLAVPLAVDLAEMRFSISFDVWYFRIVVAELLVKYMHTPMLHVYFAPRRAAFEIEKNIRKNTVSL